MAFSVTCPSCGKSFQLAQEIYERKVAGKVVSIKCKQCNAGIRIDATQPNGLKVLGASPSPAGGDSVGVQPPAGQGVRARQPTLMGMMGPGGQVTKSGGEPIGSAPEPPPPDGALWAVDSGGAGEDREIDDATIAREIGSGKITATTLVWRDGMSDWLEVSRVPQLAKFLAAAKKAAEAPKVPAAAPRPASSPQAAPAPAPAPAPPPPAPPPPAAAPKPPAAPVEDEEEATQIFRASPDAAAKYGVPELAEESSPVVTAPLPAAGKPAAGKVAAGSSPLAAGKVAGKPAAGSSPLAAGKVTAAAPAARPLPPAPAAPAPAPAPPPPPAPVVAAPAAAIPAAGPPGPPPPPRAKMPSVAGLPPPREKMPSATGLAAPREKMPSATELAAPREKMPSAPGLPPPREKMPSATGLTAPREKMPSAPGLAPGLIPPPERASTTGLAPGLIPPPERASATGLPPVRPRQQSSSALPKGLTAPPDLPRGLTPPPSPPGPPTPLPFVPSGAAPAFVPTQNPFAAGAAGPMAQLAPNPFAVATTTDLQFPEPRKKGPLIVGGVVLLLAAAGVAVALTSSGTRPPPPPVPEAPPTPAAQVPTSAPASAPVADTATPPRHADDNIAGTPAPTTSSGDFSKMFAAGAEKAHQGGSGAKTFDAEEARTAVAGLLKLVAACKEPGGPTGQSTAAVTFDAGGSVTSVTIGAPFAGTSVGTCVISAFKNAKVAPFSGLPGTVSQPVSLL